MSQAFQRYFSKIDWTKIFDDLISKCISLIFVFLVGLVILIYNRLHDLPSSQVLAMFWASCVGSRVYRLTKRKNISDIITGLISLAFLVFCLVRYFTQGR